MAFDPAVVTAGHVDATKLTGAELADLEANYPHQAGLNDEQLQAWLDTAYSLRHATDGDSDPLA